MRRLAVFIEINGTERHVGTIAGNNFTDACFFYADEYLEALDSRAISISLPLSEHSFDAVRTKNFFDGLLPEGFTRRCVAGWAHEDENDYLSILAILGNECLGAIRIIDESQISRDSIDDADLSAAAAYSKSAYIELSTDEIRKLAAEGASEAAELVTKSHLSLTGASGKVGLYYDESNDKWYLPTGKAPSTHIVKQSHVRLKRIVLNEQLCLLAAKHLGIDIPESFIISSMHSKINGTDNSLVKHSAGNNDKAAKYNDDRILLATKRYDRRITAAASTINGITVPYRLHQEDFAQAMGIASADKYEKEQAVDITGGSMGGEFNSSKSNKVSNTHTGYMQRAFRILREYSSDPIADQQRLWDICIFNYLVGNTDNHIKNISLLYSEDLKTVRLAPAYDIISTMIYSSSTDNMAMSIGGEYRIGSINRESFAREAVNVGLGPKLAMKRFDDMTQNFESAMYHAAAELKSTGFSDAEDMCRQILRLRASAFRQ